MKILHLIDSGGLYGAEKVLLNLAIEQKRQGMEPVMLSAGLPNIEDKAIEIEARKVGIEVVAWRMKAGLNIREGLRIIEWACSNGVKVLHSHGYKFNIILGLLPRRVRKLPVVSTVHGYTHTKIFSKMGLYAIIDRIALQKIDAVAFVGHHMKSKAVYMGLRNAEVIPNGIDIKYNRCDAPVELRSDLINFVSIGRLSLEKNYSSLIEAQATLVASGAKLCLWIFGEGPDRERLERIVKDLRMETNVKLPGYVADPQAWLDNFDFMVISSVTEGLPLTLLEALSVGLPVVSTAVGSIPYVISNDHLGLLVKSPSADHLTEGIMRLLSTDYKITHSVEARKRLIKESYSSAAMCNAYTSCYRSVM